MYVDTVVELYLYAVCAPDDDTLLSCVASREYGDFPTFGKHFRFFDGGVSLEARRHFLVCVVGVCLYSCYSLCDSVS